MAFAPLLFLLLFCSPIFANELGKKSEPDQIKFTLEATPTSVAPGETVQIYATFGNETKNNQSIALWSCGFTQHFKIDPPVFTVARETCFKNFLGDVKLEGGSAIRRLLKIRAGNVQGAHDLLFTFRSKPSSRLESPEREFFAKISLKITGK